MKTLFVGQHIIRLNSVDSTNNYASRLLLKEHEKNDEIILEKKNAEGTLIISEFQEKGKGQRGNEWESVAGKNLTISLILKPSFLKPDQQFLLNKIISLSIYDLAKILKIDGVAVKWPNDILVGSKKIAGILIENSIRSYEIINSIIGIGINVNQVKFDRAPDASSLKIISSKNFSRDRCLEILCSCIEARYLKLKADISSADKDYLNALYQFDQWKYYSVKGEEVSAKITGIHPSGMLVLQKENGENIFCDFKEIVFLNNHNYKPNNQNND